MTTEHLGQQLGNYRLVRLLGTGGFAQVYLGEHVSLKTYAALKLLRTRLTDEDAEYFLREAQTLARLNHPHIVRVLDFAVQEGTPFLVMEYAPGGTLRMRHPKGTRLPLQTIVRYVSQIASALQYAHDHRFIHRDVKPENMLLGSRDEVLLNDFGLAIFASHTHPYSTHELPQQMAGTPPYLAPEQLSGRPQSQSDQYALGIVVYEWLTGKLPFHGTVIEVAMQHLSLTPPSLHEQVPDLAPAIEQVVLRALAKEPEHRFACMHDFATALQRAAQTGVSLHSTPLSVSGPAADPPRPSVTVPVASVQKPSFSEPMITASSAPSPEPEEQSRSKYEPMWNMPGFLTPFIGREQEVASLCVLLQQAEVRLLTLVAMGGIGKTRLGVEAASQLRGHFADGICFVGLAPISNPDLVVPTIADALGIQETAERPLSERVKAELGQKHLLLLLDNFEQVAVAAPTVEELLLACSHLKVLVTSRAVLHLQAEHLFPVPPLELPDLSQRPAYEVLIHNAAVTLFQQRARAVLPTFHITPENVQLIAEICVRLDGLPLAIELAAARIRLLPPQALLSRLVSRLQVLTGGARTLPTRQQTLRKTLQWSYDLLDLQEQQLFRRLAVFVGGCSLEAVEALCRELGDQTSDVLNGIASLLDTCFVQQVEQAGNEPRFLLLEIIREYGLEALAASGEMGAMQRAHAAYYLTLAEEAEAEFGGPQQDVWLKRLEQEHDNLRAALSWALEQGSDEEVAYRRELALHLGGVLRQFWISHAHLSEGRTFLEQVVAASAGAAPALRAKALIAAADVALVQGDDQQGEALAKEGLLLCREVGDRAGIASCLHELGTFAAGRGEYARARSLLTESAALFRALGHRWLGWTLFSLACLDFTQGEYVRARAYNEEALAVFREQGNTEGIAEMLVMVAMDLVYSHGDIVTARSLSDEGLKLSREMGNKWLLALSLSTTAEVALIGQGDVATARSLTEESLALARELDIKYILVHTLLILAQLEARQGNYPVAQSLYEESLAFTREASDKLYIPKRYIPLSLEGLAQVVAAQGEGAWAARLWGAAESLREVVSSPLPAVLRAGYERAIATVRRQLGEKTFATAWVEGRAMTPEQVLVAQDPQTSPQQLPIGPASAPPAKTSGYPAAISARSTIS